MGAVSHEANVNLGGDASGAQAAAKTAAKEVDAFAKQVDRAKFGATKLNETLKASVAAWDQQAEAAKRAERANYIAAARMENARDRAAQLDKTFGKAGQAATVAANGITRVGAAAHGSKAPVQLLGSAVHNVAVGASTMLGAINQVAAGFGPWGVAVAAATTLLGHFAMKEYEAAEAAKKATEEIAKQKKEAARLEREEKSRRAVERTAREVDAAGAARAKASRDALDEQLHALDVQAASTKNADEKKLVALSKLKAEAQQTFDIDESKKLQRQIELAELELIYGTEKKITHEKQKQLDLSAAGARRKRGVDASTMAGVDRSIVEQAAAQQESLDAAANDDESFAALGGQFDKARAKFETDRIAQIEEAKKAAHAADMERLREEKKAQKERLALLDSTAKAAASFAAAAINSSIDIAKARREATKAALAEGKTSAEAARAGKAAELDARAARMDSIRQYMVMKSLEHAAEAIGAFARYDFVSGGLHLAAAAAFGAGAAVANARSNTLGREADDLRTGGFGAGTGGGGGGAANGNPRSGRAPIDSHIPGSPGPQAPAANSGGTQQGNSYHLHVDGAVYGLPPKRFWEEADREMSEIAHRKRRA